MVRSGFEWLDADHCVYVQSTHAGKLMVGRHINDMATAVSTHTEMTLLVMDLKKVLDLVNMGDIKWFLGMEITRNHIAWTISLSQAMYINTIMCRFNMQDSHPVSAPLDTSIILSKDLCLRDDEARHPMKDTPYLAGVGSLMYASMATCPDITYAMNKLSQFSADPGTRHWTALQRVI